MSFRVVHYKGSRQELYDKIESHLRELHDQYSADYEENFWGDTIARILRSDVLNTDEAAEVLGLAIGFLCEPVSEDWKIDAYDDLANETTGALKDLLTMFMNGRNFFTGEVGFGFEITCGYLEPSEVVDALAAFRSYEPDESSDWEKEFLESIIDSFVSLAASNSGSLFAMS